MTDLDTEDQKEPADDVSQAGGSAGPGGYRRAVRGNVLALSVVSFFTDISSDMMTWTYPLFLNLLGVGAAFIGLVEGLRETTASLLKLASGFLSDKLRRRKPLVLAGYALATVVKPFLALVTAPWHVLGLTAAERVGKGVRTSPRDGLIAAGALAEDRAKAFSFHRFMDNLGAGVGLFLAFLLVCLLVPYFSSRGLADRAVAEKVYRSIFLVASIPAVIAVMLVIFFVREKKPTGAQSVKLNFRAGFKPRFWFFLVTVLIFSLGNSSNAFLILRSQEIFARANGPVQSIIQWEIPLVLLALMLSSAAFNLPGGWLADKIGRAPVLIAGWAVYALVYLGFGFASEPWHLWCLFIAYGLFHGLSEGAERAIVADLAREEVRGSAYGLFNFAEGVAKFPASLIMGIIYVWKGPAAAFGIDAALAALAAVMLAGFLIARKRRVKA